MTTPYPSLLLLGPTAAGKTPLGDHLEARGLRGRRCWHFDFGAQLRRIDRTGEAPPGLSEADVRFIGRVLREGALLEDDRFYIAEAVLKAFAEPRVQEGDWLVLNGLPRHVGQARAIAPLADVRVVVCLECGPEVVLERLRRDPAGDRAERTDDSLEQAARKLQLYLSRTAPLVDHYAAAGARIVRIAVGPATLPSEAAAALEAAEA